MKKFFSQFGLWVFDLDGTLIDSDKDIADSVNNLRISLNLPPKRTAEIKNYIGRGALQLLVKSIPERKPQIPHLVEKFREIYSKQLLQHTSLKKGVKKFLRMLEKEKKFITVLTNKPEDLAFKIIKGLKIDSMIDYTIGGGTIDNLKPHPQGLLFLIKHFKMKKSQTIMVGDTDIDIETAKNTGSKSIFIGSQSILNNATISYLSFMELYSDYKT